MKAPRREDKVRVRKLRKERRLQKAEEKTKKKEGVYIVPCIKVKGMRHFFLKKIYYTLGAGYPVITECLRN